MKTLNDTEDAESRITWQSLRSAVRCDHEHEVIAHEERGVIKRCVKCGSLEAE